MTGVEMKKAEEVAREMVPEYSAARGVEPLPLLVDPRTREACALRSLSDADFVRKVLARLYEHAYADGYAAGKADGVSEEREHRPGGWCPRSRSGITDSVEIGFDGCAIK